ncbi:MAG: ABC transporter permease [Anaerolineales bacterium]|nr:ABC transporter permease [Anaerolineales bacterium]
MATMSSESRSDQTPAGSQLNRRQPAGRPLWLFYPASLLLLLLSWQLLVTLGGYDRFILPGPLDVARQFQIVIADGRLPYHTLVTLGEIIPGLLIGVLLATPVGYLLAKSPLAERLISPYLIASQAVPVIAIAPLIMIWIESVFWSRVAVAVLVVFFPILINVIAGLRHVPRPLYDLMTALQASRWQTFRKLELPAALPTLLAGLKVGATLSVIGTIVGEFVQPKSQGLGFLVNAARYQFKTDLVFVVILTLGLISLILYGAVALLERRLLRWQKED